MEQFVSIALYLLVQLLFLFPVLADVVVAVQWITVVVAVPALVPLLTALNCTFLIESTPLVVEQTD